MGGSVNSRPSSLGDCLSCLMCQRRPRAIEATTAPEIVVVRTSGHSPYTSTICREKKIRSPKSTPVTSMSAVKFGMYKSGSADPKKMSTMTTIARIEVNATMV